MVVLSTLVVCLKQANNVNTGRQSVATIIVNALNSFGFASSSGAVCDVAEDRGRTETSDTVSCIVCRVQMSTTSLASAHRDNEKLLQQIRENQTKLDQMQKQKVTKRSEEWMLAEKVCGFPRIKPSAACEEKQKKTS
uniref:Secreted protein n=1 Tax=Caenorhabditis tropicalis TaxID=1561998 RepID=A0A1I7V2M9_9PELO